MLMLTKMRPEVASLTAAIEKLEMGTGKGLGGGDEGRGEFAFFWRIFIVSFVISFGILFMNVHMF